MNYFFAPDKFETESFILRSFLAGDGEALYDATQSSLEHLRPWLRWSHDESTPQSSENLVRTFRANYLKGTDFTLGVFHKDNKTLLGGTGFHRFNMRAKNSEIGIWIAHAHASKGLGTKVLKEVLNWGFSGSWPWECLFWMSQTTNTGSSRVAEKNGLTKEGLLRNFNFDAFGRPADFYRYSILKSEWGP